MSAGPSPRAVALGFSVHTGWAALVAVTRSGGASLTVLDRRRIGMLPVPLTPRPEAYPHVFHAARDLPLSDAERFIRKAEEQARVRAREELAAAVEGLRAGGHRVMESAIITARELPTRPLEEREAILDRYYGAYETLVRENPVGHGKDYVYVYLTIAKTEA